jgi:hypothetical protein
MMAAYLLRPVVHAGGDAAWMRKHAAELEIELSEDEDEAEGVLHLDEREGHS